MESRVFENKAVRFSRFRGRRRWQTWASILFLLVWLSMLPLSGYLLVQAQAETQGAGLTNPRADTWRLAREAVPGYTAVTGQEAGVLIQNGGQNWRQVRNGPVANYGGWFVGSVFVGIGVFFLIRGKIRLAQGRSGKSMLRWTAGERVLHWYTATLFILLAVSGLSLLFGRAVLIPVLGHEAFSAYALLAKLVHNYLGPLFIVGIVLEIVYWMKFNIPGKVDWRWFKQGGGLIGNKHPSAGKMNGGEKLWFWVIFFVGLLVVSITGLILDFPNFGQEREVMQIANLVHAVGAFVFIAFALGHIYIGTLGTEGALEGMTRGYVDVNWAKQHHDLWYQRQMRGSAAEDGAVAASRGRSPDVDTSGPS